MKSKNIAHLFINAVILASPMGLAQQPPSAYSYRSVLQPGMTIGGYTFTSDTRIDGIGLNDDGDLAFVARWSDVIGYAHSAVFAPDRLVAADGDVIEGKTITSIAATCFALNNAGLVAFEALYRDASGTHTGVFVGKKFFFDVTGSGSANDFILTDDGRVIPRGGTQSPVTSPAPAPTQTATAKDPSMLKGIRLPKSLIKVLNNPNSPVTVDPNGLPQQGQTQPKPAQQAPPRPSASAAMPPAQPVRPVGPCPVPAFPLPQEWDIGAQMTGPVTSQLFDAAVKGRTFESPYYGHLNSPFRAIQFGGDCHPLVIAIGDSSMRGRFEIYTPAGMLTYRRPDGAYEFNGFPGRVENGSFVRTDAMLRINRKGQILIPVTLSPNGYALLLGTPIAH